MNEPYPGGRRQPNHANQPNNWPDNDWFRQERLPERGPGPRDVATERGPGGHQRYGSHRRPELTQTTVDQLTVVHRPAARYSERRLPVNLNSALISRNWALIAGLLFFLIDTIVMADGFTRPVGAASRLLVIFIWLASVVVVALLWLRGSSRFSIQNPFVRVETDAHER